MDQRLNRVLSLREAVGIGVGGTIGGGIFVLIGTAAGLAGPATLLSFILAFSAAVAISLPYAELACRYPEAGGGYAFARIVLGRRWGFLMGWMFWGAYIFISGYVTFGFGGYLHTLIGVSPIAGRMGLIAVAVTVNLLGIRMSGRAQSLVVLLAVVGLLSFAAIGIGNLEIAHFTPISPNGLGAVASAALLAFLAFGGFDMIAAAGEEVANPERTIPLAMLLTLAIVLGLYLAVTFVALGVMPWQELGASDAPLAEAAERFLGPRGGTFAASIALLTTAATTNAILVVTSRISFAMARDGLLPPALAKIQIGTKTPWVAILANGFLFGAVAIGASMKLAIATGGFLYVGHFVPPLLAFAILRKRVQEPSPFMCPAPRLVLPLALSSCVVLMASSGPKGALGGAFWLALGLALRGALAHEVGQGHRETASLDGRQVPQSVDGCK